MPPEWELWLDGGHNDSAGEVLARQAEAWAEDARPLHLICGMLTTKAPQEFLRPLAPYLASFQAVPIPDSSLSFAPAALAAEAQASGLHAASAAPNITSALRALFGPPGRVLICGSLYLAGHVLAENGTVIR